MKRSLATAAMVGCLSAGLLTAAAACSFSFGSSKAVAKSDVVKSIQEKLTDSAGNKPDKVTCPNDLDAKVGAVITCTMVFKDKPVDVDVTVSKIDGDQVNYDMVVTMNKDEVANEISSQLEAQVGRKPEKIVCPANLPGKVGAVITCDLTDGSQVYGVKVTVTTVDAGSVNFDFKVDDQPKSPAQP